MENEIIDAADGQPIITDSEIKSYLNETSKWAKFLAILGFIGIGFIVLAALFAGAFLGSDAGRMGMRNAEFPLSPAVITLLYLLFAVIYFFPVYYLYNFAVKMKNSLLSGDSALMRESFKNLKSHYKYIGILTIVVISLYILGIIYIIFAAGSLR